MAVCLVVLRGQQIYTVIQAVHSLLYIVAMCHFFSVVTWTLLLLLIIVIIVIIDNNIFTKMWGVYSLLWDTVWTQAWSISSIDHFGDKWGDQRSDAIHLSKDAYLISWTLAAERFVLGLSPHLPVQTNANTHMQRNTYLTSRLAGSVLNLIGYGHTHNESSFLES